MFLKNQIEIELKTKKRLAEKKILEGINFLISVLGMKSDYTLSDFMVKY